VLVTGVRQVVDHLRKLGYQIPRNAVVSSYNQSESAYEYLGKANSNIDAEIQLKPIDATTWQFCLNLKLRFTEHEVSDQGSE
jgi:hypothetical protein